MDKTRHTKYGKTTTKMNNGLFTICNDGWMKKLLYKVNQILQELANYAVFGS